MSSSAQPEVLFYHLEHFPLERVLPSLLEKSLARGWRVVVQAGSDDRVDALNQFLWTYRDDSFLPHGAKKDGRVDRQPIYLTANDENPNQATVRFFVDQAEISDLSGLARAVYIFDGANQDAVVKARLAWKDVKNREAAATYWQQTAEGGWQKKA